MTGPARRLHVATVTVSSPGTSARDLWQAASRIRQEWLDHGLSTQPADRATAEGSITAIYAGIGRPRPRFAWVDSPRQALPLIRGLPTLDQLYQWIRDPSPTGPPPLASDLAAAASRLRATLSGGVVHGDPDLSPARRPKSKDPWPELPPLEALAVGIPLPVVLHQGLRTALHRSLAHGVAFPVRAAISGDRPVPVCWYGQQDASWIAYYDALHRLGLARYGPDEARQLGDWAALARSGGWWWPGEQVCVVVEHPQRVRVEPVPGTRHGEVRLAPDGVEYRDGWRPMR